MLRTRRMMDKEAKARAMGLGSLLKPQNLKLALFGLLGIGLILLGTFFTAGAQGAQAQGESAVDLSAETASIEAAIEEVVGAIRGVGKVQAKVTLESGPQSVYARNVTRSSSSQSETLENGAARESLTENETSQPVSGRFGVSESPLLEKVIPVKVAGCLIVAEGASSSRVKADIYRAAQALLGIPIYKIEVAPMKGGK